MLLIILFLPSTKVPPLIKRITSGPYLYFFTQIQFHINNCNYNLHTIFLGCFGVWGGLMVILRFLFFCIFFHLQSYKFYLSSGRQFLFLFLNLIFKFIIFNSIFRTFLCFNIWTSILDYLHLAFYDLYSNYLFLFFLAVRQKHVPYLLFTSILFLIYSVLSYL